MKYQAICFAVIVGLMSLITYSQDAKEPLATKKPEKTPNVLDTLTIVDPTDSRKIIYYFVQEKVNVSGGYTTTYKVSKLSLIPTYNLGPGNTRTITPIYGGATVAPVKILKLYKSQLKPTSVAELTVIGKQRKGLNNTNSSSVKPDRELEQEIITKNTEFIKTTKSEKVVHVYPIETFERIAEKGYKSIDIFQKLGDSYFFKGDYLKAVKWYKELFNLTTELDSVYYERYSYSLRAIGLRGKANETIKKLSIKNN